MTRDVLRERLRAAVEQVLAHRQAEIEARRRRRALKALGQAKSALQGSQAAGAQVDELVQRLTQPTASLRGDRWAVAREVSLLLAEGEPKTRILYALIDVGACKGPQRSEARRCCGEWLRQERRRYRLRT